MSIRITSSGRTCSAALVLSLTLSTALLASASAHATPATAMQSVSFSTGTQSLWGPGRGTASFGASGSASVPATFFTPEVGVGYSFGASSGTAVASVGGNVAASYDDHLSAPGTASIQLSYAPTSGSFSTNLGASASLTGFVHDVPFFGPWDFCIYCQNWSLQTGSSATPGFGTTRSGTDAVSVAGVGPNIGVASATLNLNATQQSNLRLDSLRGVLRATNQTTGTTHLTPFTGAGSSLVGVTLDENGVWDFSLLSLDLGNTFWSTMGAGFSFDIDVFGVISESFPFANVPLLSTGGFELDFAERTVTNLFSITVPEPGTALLLASGLLGLLVFQPRRIR